MAREFLAPGICPGLPPRQALPKLGRVLSVPLSAMVPAQHNLVDALMVAPLLPYGIPPYALRAYKMGAVHVCGSDVLPA